MSIRRQTLAIVAVLTIAGSATAAFATASTPVADPQPAVAAAPLIDNARVPMTEALAKAEKAHGAKAERAMLRDTRPYGLVWDVRLTKVEGDSEKDRTRIRTLVDAQTGDVLASDVMGIARNHHRDGRWGYRHHRGFEGDGRYCREEGRMGR